MCQQIISCKVSTLYTNIWSVNTNHQFLYFVVYQKHVSFTEVSLVALDHEHKLKLWRQQITINYEKTQVQRKQKWKIEKILNLNHLHKCDHNIAHIIFHVLPKSMWLHFLLAQYYLCSKLKLSFSIKDWLTNFTKIRKKKLLSKDYCKIIETDCKLHFVDC